MLSIKPYPQGFSLSYFILYILLYPLLLALSFFRKSNNTSKNLIIQTAKIGDYVNTSIMFDVLSKTDVIIDKVNYSFAKNENKIKNIYLIDELKKCKIKSAIKIFTLNYKNIYVLMPNNFNTFLAATSFANNISYLQTYSTKTYLSLMMFNFEKKIHTKEDLTLNSYLKLINKNYTYKDFKKTLPLVPINFALTNSFKIGISLSAGNRLKTIDNKTWLKIFQIISSLKVTIYIFGLDSEKEFLNSFITIFNTLHISYISLLGSIPIENLPFAISKMDMYISSDTGNSYIADTFNIPLINFAGPCYMKEQRPIGKDVLIIDSNADCVPFSFIFNAPYDTNCKDLYKITDQQEKIILNFIISFYNSYLQP